MTALVGLEDRRRLVQLVHQSLGLREFLAAADRALAEFIPFDTSCWLSLDPSTLMPTSHFTRNVDADHLRELAANEFLVDDVNKFASLARARRPVGILSVATSGDLMRSPRFAQLLAPHGHQNGDELRAVFVDGGSVWGCVAVHRKDRRFDRREARAVAGVCGYFAEGIRRSILTTALAGAGESDTPGLVLLRGDGSVETVTPAARRWLAEIVDSAGGQNEFSVVVACVAGMARSVAQGDTEQIASARLPRRSGGWLRLHASLLDGDASGRVAVIVAPAGEAEIADVIVRAYGLSTREQGVTRLVLHGFSTREIARHLSISSYTVQDHLKAIFAKVGVDSRRELAARLFFQHYAPRLGGGAEVSPGGQISDP